MVGRYVFVINSAHPACCPTRSVLLGADLDANQHEVYCWVQIWMQTKGRVSHFVAGGSTGGTISGTGRFLKDMNPKIKVMLPDPVGSVFWDFWANRKAEKDLEAKSYQVHALSCLVMQNRFFCAIELSFDCFKTQVISANFASTQNVATQPGESS
jgi:hypothetical protein